MKRILSLLAIATFASCSLFAQDDIYFTPKSKAVKDKEKAEAKAAEEKGVLRKKQGFLRQRKNGCVRTGNIFPRLKTANWSIT